VAFRAGAVTGPPPGLRIIAVLLGTGMFQTDWAYIGPRPGCSVSSVSVARPRCRPRSATSVVWCPRAHQPQLMIASPHEHHNRLRHSSFIERTFDELMTAAGQFRCSLTLLSVFPDLKEIVSSMFAAC
jgi:hypothetical protein